METKNLSNEIPLGKSYKLSITRNIGRGAFGEVFLGKNIKTNERVAVKMESKKTLHPLLQYESKVLRYLQGGSGIPKLYETISTSTCNFMIFELLGPNFETLLNKCSRSFSLKTIVKIGLQMLDRIEYMHKRHVIHRDIKPDNFLIGAKNTNKVYIVDFGLAKKFRDCKTGLHIPYKDGKNLTGTARYASIYTHLGIEQSRRDDLESLAYTLVYFDHGELPWMGIKAKVKEEKYNKILEKKINTKIETIIDDLPEQFGDFIQYVRGLQFEEKPNYAYLRNLLRELEDRYKCENSLISDIISDEKDSEDKKNTICLNTTTDNTLQNNIGL